MKRLGWMARFEKSSEALRNDRYEISRRDRFGAELARRGSELLGRFEKVGLWFKDDRVSFEGWSGASAVLKIRDARRTTLCAMVASGHRTQKCFEEWAGQADSSAIERLWSDIEPKAFRMLKTRALGLGKIGRAKALEGLGASGDRLEWLVGQALIKARPMEREPLRYENKMMEFLQSRLGALALEGLLPAAKDFSLTIVSGQWNAAAPSGNMSVEGLDNKKRLVRCVLAWSGKKEPGAVDGNGWLRSDTEASSFDFEPSAGPFGALKWGSWGHGAWVRWFGISRCLESDWLFFERELVKSHEWLMDKVARSGGEGLALKEGHEIAQTIKEARGAKRDMRL